MHQRQIRNVGDIETCAKKAHQPFVVRSHRVRLVVEQTGGLQLLPNENQPKLLGLGGRDDEGHDVAIKHHQGVTQWYLQVLELDRKLADAVRATENLSIQRRFVTEVVMNCGNIRACQTANFTR